MARPPIHAGSRALYCNHHESIYCVPFSDRPQPCRLSLRRRSRATRTCYADQRGRAEARTELAVHDDAGGDVQPAVAHCVPARWPHAGHREGRPGLAGHAAGREDAGRRTCRRSCTRARAACWACSCRRTTRPTTASTSRMRSRARTVGIEPGARARAADDRREHGEPRWTAGALARHAEGPRRTVRRRRSRFRPTASTCS